MGKMIYPEYFGIAATHSYFFQVCAAIQLNSKKQLFESGPETDVGVGVTEEICAILYPSYYVVAAGISMIIIWVFVSYSCRRNDVLSRHL